MKTPSQEQVVGFVLALRDAVLDDGKLILCGGPFANSPAEMRSMRKALRDYWKQSEEETRKAWNDPTGYTMTDVMIALPLVKRPVDDSTAAKAA